MIADIALRKRDYDDEALFDASGRYGSFDWVSLGTMVVASVLGWGLVVNNFSTSPPGTTGRATCSSRSGSAPGWRPTATGRATGPTPTSACSLALVLGFAVTYVARRGTVARQEARRRALDPSGTVDA